MADAESRARMLTALTLGLVVLSLMFALLRADVQSKNSSTPDDVVVGIASWGPQLRSGDVHVGFFGNGDVARGYHGITVHASWWSDALATGSDDLLKQSPPVHIAGDVALGKTGFVFTYGGALVLAGVALAVLAGVKGPWAPKTFAWAAFVGAGAFILGYALTVWAGLGLASDFRSTAAASDNLTISSGPGAALFLEPLAAVAAALMGWFWLKSRAPEPVPGAAAAGGGGWPPLPASAEHWNSRTVDSPSGPGLPPSSNAPPAAPKRPQGPFT